MTTRPLQTHNASSIVTPAEPSPSAQQGRHLRAEDDHAVACNDAANRRDRQSPHAAGFPGADRFNQITRPTSLSRRHLNISSGIKYNIP